MGYFHIPLTDTKTHLWTISEKSIFHRKQIYLDLTLVLENKTLDHKTSHKGQFFKIEIYTSSESWINTLSIDIWFIRTGKYLVEIQLFEYLESESAKQI